jgi:hypothetical protein
VQFTVLAGSSRAADTINGAIVVARHSIVFNSPPGQVPTNGMPDGPLLGNGDVGVVMAGSPEEQRFWIGKNDFWRRSSPGVDASSNCDVSLNWMENCPYAGVSLTCSTSDGQVAWYSLQMSDMSGKRTEHSQLRSAELPTPYNHPGPYASEYAKIYEHNNGNWIRRNVLHNYRS